MAARLLLGLIFVVFGLNYFFNFMPDMSMTPQMGAYMAGLTAAKYFWPLLKITEIFAGLLLLANVWVGLALVLLSPVVVNILFTHAVLDTSGLWLAIVITLLTLHLGWAYFDKFSGLFTKAQD